MLEHGQTYKEKEIIWLTSNIMLVVSWEWLIDCLKGHPHIETESSLGTSVKLIHLFNNIVYIISHVLRKCKLEFQHLKIRETNSTGSF